MKLRYNKQDDKLTVLVDGRLDTTTARDFEAEMEANLADVSALTIDCEKLAYVSSAGLRVLLKLQKKMPNAMKLIHVGELVMEVFEITGFVDVLVIE